MNIDKEQAHTFRQELQQARENAFKDAEAFDGIIHVVERLGQFCLGRVGDLGQYENKLSELAAHSPLAYQLADDWRTVHQPFKQLYTLVRNARNDALHIGARARTLTDHAIQLSLILEDALRVMEDSELVADYMVRNPICAQLWQPLSFARQIMLANSFSYLPLQKSDGEWYLLSDLAIAKYLRGVPNNERKRRMAQPLSDADLGDLPKAIRSDEDKSIQNLLNDPSNALKEQPCLVFRDSELVGIVAPFDLL